MNNEPEREIEKQLRDYARRRREQSGAPMDLHPATRRLLQGEVARAHFARGMGSVSPRRFSKWRLQWLAGLATVCVIALAVILPSALKTTNRDKSTMDLAKNTDVPRLAGAKSEGVSPQPVNEPAGTAAPTPAAPESSTSLAMKQSIVSDAAKDLSPAPIVPSEAAQSEFKARDEKSNQLASAVAPATRDAAAPPPAPATVTAPPVEVPLDAAEKDAVRTGGRGDMGRFPPGAPVANAPLESQQFALDGAITDSFAVAKKPATSTVLTNFRVEQTGNQLRVIDSDGSVYSGSIQAPGVQGRRTGVALDLVEPEAAASGGQQKVARSSPANRAAAPSVYGTRGFADATSAPTNTMNFRLRGTNLTLHKLVEFTGDFISTNGLILTNAVTNASAVLRGKAATGAGTNFGNQQLQLRNSILRGRAIIGGTNQIEINAHPAVNPP